MSDEKKVDLDQVKKDAAGGLKSWFFKDGEFSKTAAFATLANMLVLGAYVMSWAAGTEFQLGDMIHLTIPAFDDSSALTLLAIVNGTYLSNNVIKNSKAKAQMSAEASGPMA